MIITFLYFLVFTILIFSIIFILFNKNKELNNIYNLFYEIYVHKHELDKIDYSITNHYKGRIKTLYPNGKEKVIWESKSSYLSKQKCEEDTKKRFEFLSDFYKSKINKHNL